MRRYFFFILFLLVLTQGYTQEYNDYFCNKTLRADFIFAGNSTAQSIFLDDISSFPVWVGRRYHLCELPLKGNGEIEMKDASSGKVIYRTSFATLFQEWLTTEEAKTVSRSYENCYLLPFPKKAATLTLSLKNAKDSVITAFTHTIDPEDILIGQTSSDSLNYIYLQKNGEYENCIDIAILAEGYTAAEMELFIQDAQKVCESLFSHEPFKSYQNKFNVVAVKSLSSESGVSIPKRNEWKNTAFNSHFSTFYTDRYLTTTHTKAIHDALKGIPYEHIIILANTAYYGGGGIYNTFTLTAAHNSSFPPVIVHEFGHSFGGLADEYYYKNDLFSETYPPDQEPWEPNITTLTDFSSKWKCLLKPDTPVPTPYNKQDLFPVGVYEGAGYSSKGIYRSAVNCRMKSNEAKEFCPACTKALVELIQFYTNK